MPKLVCSFRFGSKEAFGRVLLCLLLTAMAAYSERPFPAQARGSSAPKATLILTNGRIWTGNEAAPWATAVAITGGKIIAIGSERQIAALAGKNTLKIDLSGRFAMPGINDAHIHFLSGSLRAFQVDLDGARSLEEIQRRVAAFAKDNPEESWITGSGWEYSYLPGMRLPDRADLDAAVRERPVFLSSYDGHTAWVNSKALEIAGVNGQSKFEGYGEVVIDQKTGQPTGVLKESAMRLVRAKIPEPTRERKMEALRRALKMAARLGITSFQNASGSADEAGLYKELFDRGELTARVSFAISVGPRSNQADIDRIGTLAKAYSGPRLRVGAIKIVVDGVIETHTAAMIEPYSDAPETSGRPAYTQDQLNKLVVMADRAGLQVLIHAIGDRGVRMALDAFDHARRVNGQRDSRFRIEHIETVSASDIPRFAKLGVMASMEPIHADPGTNGVWLPAIGPERAARGFAWRSLEKAGARLVFSSDWPAAISVDPMRGLHNAVNRQTTGGEPAGGWLPEQRVSVETALAAYTSAGAFASFEEKLKGKLAPGMLADLIVLDADPFKANPADLHKCRVAITVFDGRLIHQADQR
ncbi:MAG: amidohydrolase family protein [Acidobacteriota bacterium]